ncbi:TPA: hypothetical protein ACGHH5_003204 [Salmonella enterica subsp. enterica serovar 1,4,[5],12:b:-]
MVYDEYSIRILPLSEILKFDWHRAEQLADEHRVPLEWVKRGFEASRRMSIEPEYFINRYLLKTDLTPNPEFEQVFTELVRENRK